MEDSLVSQSRSAVDVEGFAAVAFPIVRRVFGGLIANELVSVQPMSLPSGLIFFLDFTFSDQGDQLSLGGYANGESVYGGGKVGSQITGGVDLTGTNSEKSFYALNNGYASPAVKQVSVSVTPILSGTVGSGLLDDVGGELEKAVRYDPDLSGSIVVVGRLTTSTLTAQQFNFDNFVTLTVSQDGQSPLQFGRQIRRLTGFSGSAETHTLVVLEASWIVTGKQNCQN